ncbi:MAG: hypothetical protein ACFFG0_29700, partial [Candidatus Thorarchaeota archaeon]
KIRNAMRKILLLSIEDRLKELRNISKIYRYKKKKTKSQKKREYNINYEKGTLNRIYGSGICYCSLCRSSEKDMLYFPLEDSWYCKECTMKNSYILENGFKLRRKSNYLYRQGEFNIERVIIDPKKQKPPLKFEINDFFSLILEDDITKIYVEGEEFSQCKFLLIDIPINEVRSLSDIKSIDEAAEKLNSSLEVQPQFERKFRIPPKVEFWGHCSNMQVWAEQNYDTRLLHRDIAFPLLKRLTEVGDPLAKKVFKEEIAKRYKSGFSSVVKYLEEEGYLKYLSKEELETLK